MLSLDRQRHALAAKVVFTYADSFWHDNGQNGDAYFETAVIGGTWVQREGIMSTLVPPERLAAFLTTSQAQLEAELTEEMVEAFGEGARDTEAVFFRRWGVDPWTLGYITGWRPGDVMSVGPLHGTHEPPFYVCGSDQWVCGYMEGAVRTGRRRRRCGPCYLRKISTCTRRFLPWAEATVGCNSCLCKQFTSTRETHRMISTARRTLVPAGTWTVDPAHSTVGFSVKHLGIATVRGKFEEFEGTLEIGEGDASARAYGTVQGVSINTGDARPRRAPALGGLLRRRGEPGAPLRVDRDQPVDEDTFEIVGDLSMNGVTKPVTLTAEVQGEETDPWGNERVAPRGDRPAEPQATGT